MSTSVCGLFSNCRHRSRADRPNQSSAFRYIDSLLESQHHHLCNSSNNNDIILSNNQSNRNSNLMPNTRQTRGWTKRISPSQYAIDRKAAKSIVSKTTTTMTRLPDRLKSLSPALGLVLLIIIYSICQIECLNNNINNNNNDRVFIVKQTASNSASSKQSKQTFKEISKKLVIHVKENTPIGTRLASIQPSDEELLNQQLPLEAGRKLGNEGANSNTPAMTYSFIGDFDQQAFSIHINNDEIELRNDALFDYESEKRSYYVMIRAISIYLRYELEVDILVEDENDNKPNLDDFAIIFNNYKNNFPTGPIGRVPASDLDVSDVLRYRVVSGNNAQLIIVNETNGDIQLSPWLNSNVPMRAPMDIAVSDGINEVVKQLVLTVNLVTEQMLHNSVVLQLDEVSRDEFLSRKYNDFLTQMARILSPPRTLTVGGGHHSAVSSASTGNGYYSIKQIVIFDVEELRGPLSVASGRNQQNATTTTTTTTTTTSNGITVSFSARSKDTNDDIESYLSPRYIEERVYLNRLQLSQALGVQVASVFREDPCVHEPCQNYQECQVTYKFDKAPKVFYTNEHMIFRSIKASQTHGCTCPSTFTGMKHKQECNLQINECFRNPCQNGGQCHRRETGYTCECRQGGDYFGPNCELSMSNSTCQSAAIAINSPLSSSSGASSSGSLLTQAASSVCSGKSICSNLPPNRAYGPIGSSSSRAAASTAPTNHSLAGFVCLSCPYSSQWSTDLCQLRTRSFERGSYLVLASLKRRHRFHLSLKLATTQNDALIFYNGRFNDKHDFVALEIVDSRLKFSYSLGGNLVYSITLSQAPVSNGDWHKVSIDYREGPMNVTLLIDDCDPVIDEALARYSASGSQVSRCSNSSVAITTTTSNNYFNGNNYDSTTTTTAAANELQQQQQQQQQQPAQNGEYRMLDLNGPMLIGSLPATLINLSGGIGGSDGSIQRLASRSYSYIGCLGDIRLDHQLVDLSSAYLMEFATQPGCPERQNYCRQHQCNGFPCRDTFSGPKCQCGEDRLGKNCEIQLRQEKVRKFSGNSYLTFNPIESQIGNSWHASLYFRSINPNGVLMKILLEQPLASIESQLQLELYNGGLRLSHKPASALTSTTTTTMAMAANTLNFNKFALDDGDWHFVEIIWPANDLVQLQVDHNYQTHQSGELGSVSGATIKSVIVGSSYTRSSSLLSSSSSSSSSSLIATASALQAAPPLPPPAQDQVSAISAQAPQTAIAESSANANNIANGDYSSQPSTLPPSTLLTSDTSDYQLAYLNGTHQTSQLTTSAAPAASPSFVGCIFNLNVSSSVVGAEIAADWWLSSNDERNVERGCQVVDVCESQACPENSRCIKNGINKRKCVCNTGFVGDQHQCLPVCSLSPCQGEKSHCLPVLTSSTSFLLTNNDDQQQQQQQVQDQPAASQASYTCECEPDRSGKNCEHQLSSKCPSNFWGRPIITSSSSMISMEYQTNTSLTSTTSGTSSSSGSSSLCGPCNCDESRGFDGDCDKTSGQCFCKQSHYQPSGADYCLPCDCYLVGSLGSGCNQTTGQCKCRPGVVGRRCDSCSSAYAEVTRRGCEVIYDACPRAYSDGIWWEKTPLAKTATQQCPQATSTGMATRECHPTEGWRKPNLFDCISNTFNDLYTQYQFLEENKFQMNSQLAQKIASQLRQALNETISSSLIDGGAGGAAINFASYSSPTGSVPTAAALSAPLVAPTTTTTTSTTTTNTPTHVQLYGSDMYISFRLLHHLIQHELNQTGLQLTHKQDRLYIRNLAESVSHLLDPQYASNWPEIAKRSPQVGAEYLLKLMDSYGRVLIDSQLDTSTQPFEVVTKYFTFGMDTISTEQLYDLNKWAPQSLLAASGASGISPANNALDRANQGPSSSSANSPPYVADPFDSPPYHQSRHHLGAQSGASFLGSAVDSTPTSTTTTTTTTTTGAAGHYNADGLSIYMDFSATRDSSPSVVIPKYDNYMPDNLATISSDQTSTKAIIPLKTLRIKTAKELSAALGAPTSTGIGSMFPFPYYSSMSSAVAAPSSMMARSKRDLNMDYNTIRSAGSMQQQQQQLRRPALVVYSIFKTLGPLLPANYDNTVQNRLGILAQANSPVVWLTVRPSNSSEFLTKNLQPKVTYMLKLNEPIGKTRPQCAIWDFVQSFNSHSSTGQSAPAATKQTQTNTQQQLITGTATTTTTTTTTIQAATATNIRQTGRFTTRGCEIKGVHPNHRLRYKSDYVNCSCDHFGAVVVLMDQANGNNHFDYLTGYGYDSMTNVRDLSLQIAILISIIILSSILFILSCIRGHSIKSNSNSINKNLLIILIIIEALVLYSLASRSSLQQLEYQCKLVAIFLHYFSISLFLWLLINAIHFYRMLTELRDINHGPMRFYHTLGYAIPAFFVCIAIGLRIEQFGNYLFCWLSIHEPIIWSMLGPISVVSILIIITFKLALCKSLPLGKDMVQQDPTGANLIRKHMLINVIKTPLIGVYWLITVWAVNEALADWLMILYPFLIVLKSMVLFGLLCIVDKYIRYNLYVSWLRFKGEKIPYNEHNAGHNHHHHSFTGQQLNGQQQNYQQYGNSLYGSQQEQQWQSLMSMNQGDFGFGPSGTYGKQIYGSQLQQQHQHQTGSLGQMLYGSSGATAAAAAAAVNGQVRTPGFQQMNADQPGNLINGQTDDNGVFMGHELFSGLSLTSTTSRSTATGTSASVISGGRHRRRRDNIDQDDNDDDDEDQLDGLDGASSDYGRSRRRRHKRSGGGGKKHHHHHHRHHHHGRGDHYHHGSKHTSAKRRDDRYHEEHDDELAADESLVSTAASPHYDGDDTSALDQASDYGGYQQHGRRHHSHGHGHHRQHHHGHRQSAKDRHSHHHHHHHHSGHNHKQNKRADRRRHAREYETTGAVGVGSSNSPPAPAPQLDAGSNQRNQLDELGPALASSHSSDVEQTRPEPSLQTSQPNLAVPSEQVAAAAAAATTELADTSQTAPFVPEPSTSGATKQQ